LRRTYEVILIKNGAGRKIIVLKITHKTQTQGTQIHHIKFPPHTKTTNKNTITKTIQKELTNKPHIHTKNHTHKFKPYTNQT